MTPCGGKQWMAFGYGLFYLQNHVIPVAIKID